MVLKDKAYLNKKIDNEGKLFLFRDQDFKTMVINIVYYWFRVYKLTIKIR